jgi:molybdopterin converting factor small subunit
MQVKLKLSGLLREYYQLRPYPREENVDLSNGANVADVFDQYKIPYDRVHLVIVNRRHADLKTSLKDGDEVWALPLAAGG